MTASLTFDDHIATIASADRRYDAAAYHFVFRALDFVLEQRERASSEPLPPDSHVSAVELLDGLRDYALELYGPLARLVLGHWGLSCTEDFGEIVFRLVDCQLLNKQDSDRKSDFSNGFDFREAFAVSSPSSCEATSA